MKIFKTLYQASTTITCLCVIQCASMQNASVADYNRDGVISDAEYRQYNKQKNIERQNVYTERAKRDNAVDVVRDARNTAWYARSFKGIMENF